MWGGNKMFCENCGHKNEEGAKFCESCGHPMTVEVSVEEEHPADLSATTRSNPSKKSRLGIIIGVLLLLIVVVGGYLMFLGGGSTDGEVAGSKTEERTDKEDSEETQGKKQALRMQISQVDNSEFPKMTLYTQVSDRNGEQIEGLEKETFSVTEIGPDGTEQQLEIQEILPVDDSFEMNINLVLDQSGSMDEDDKIQNAKQAASRFVDEILSKENNSVEITSFDDYVYNVQPFTSDKAKVMDAIRAIDLGSQTALYDALYDALIQTNQTNGSRFVIAFTDGEENASLHTEEEVVELSKQTGIPVYIIGIGSLVDSNYLEAFTALCNGDFYSAEVSDLSNVLLEIYEDIYGQQKDLYKITYTSKSKDQLDQYHRVLVTPTETSEFSGKTELEFMPQDTIAAIDNSELLKIIESKTQLENAAVAIVDLDTDMEFRVGNARQSYVASGFYAPIYTVASNADKSSGDTMMKKMDNDAGNTLIDKYGGLSEVTRALSDKGYTQTVFNRKFGDVRASENGYENYTSAVDSAKILRDIYLNDGYKNMNWDLTKDGISVPSNATIYVHRGQGIGAAYNVFAIIESDKANYGIAIMTAHTGTNDDEAKAVAVPMISDILVEVHKGMTGD